MKPVEYVSVGGYMFCLEEDACTAARSYLEELSAFYSKEEGGPEVMEGIEERMSELLLEQGPEGGVVTLPMVERVIAILGKPEAIEEESESGPDSGPGDGRSASKSAHEAGKEEKVRRKLYRDPDQGKLAGVCSGLGIYFGVDPTIFRLLFVAFSLIGLGFFFRRGMYLFPDYLFPVIYIVLWICMPIAKTVSQRDELRGEKGTVDAISARVRSSARKMGEAAETVVHSSLWSGIWRIMEVCIGIVMLVVGVAGVVSLGCLFIGENLVTSSFLYNRFVEEVCTEVPVILDLLSFAPLVIALAITVVVPFIAMIYGGVMMIFDLKAPKWHPGLCIFVIWLIALTVLAVLTTLMLAKGL